VDVSLSPNRMAWMNCANCSIIELLLVGLFGVLLVLVLGSTRGVLVVPFREVTDRDRGLSFCD
jgi:hypothetical protein